MAVQGRLDGVVCSLIFGRQGPAIQKWRYIAPLLGANGPATGATGSRAGALSGAEASSSLFSWLSSVMQGARHC